MTREQPVQRVITVVLIGEVQGDGQFEVVWETSGLVVGDEYLAIRIR